MIHLYYRPLPETDRWLPLDRHPRRVLRRLIRGKPQGGGIDKVFTNLCLGLDLLSVQYRVNTPFENVGPRDWVGVLGRGSSSLAGYNLSNPIVAGIGLMTHPSEWPELPDEYPITFYLQHSAWARDVYRPYYGDERCRIWPVGIDTVRYDDAGPAVRTQDVLLYDKVMWNREDVERDLVTPLRLALQRKGLGVVDLRYGSYRQEDYRKALQTCRAMVFLCEHESQGLAYQEALSSGVPILAWDPGWCLDPNRFAWGDPVIPSTSVPYFDERCGKTFVDLSGFEHVLDEFWDGVQAGAFSPREYILDTLTLERRSQEFVDLLAEANG